MVRSVIGDERFLSYVSNLSTTDSCTVGLILGQPTPNKDYIIHMARTPPCQGDTSATPSLLRQPKTVNDISDKWVADHARHATRMLPGGMYVLGIFLVTEDNILTPFSPKIKSILTTIQKQLATNEFLYGNATAVAEKLVFNYSSKTRQHAFMSYDTVTSTARPATIKFQPKMISKWIQVECNYELDQSFLIGEGEADWTFKKRMNAILYRLDQKLKTAVFLLNGEIKDGDDVLETIGKKRKVPRAKTPQDDGKIQVTILLPCVNNNEASHPPEIRNCSGQIKFNGHVACKLWLHPTATVNMAAEAVREDLIRSLAARLEMHWDSLIADEQSSPNDSSTIHEPPRRVLVSLPNSKLTLSDYLFPGEGPQEAQISLQELLDIKITKEDCIKDVEGQADLSELYTEKLETDSDETLQKIPESNRYIYFAGFGIAFLVLVISLVVHFIKIYFK